MKQTCILYLLLTLNLNCFSQSITDGRGCSTIDPDWIQRSIRESSHIIEATVIKQTASYLSSGNVYTSAILQIHKILKGELQCGTVELVAMGGNLETKDTINGKLVTHISYDRGVHVPPKGLTGMFICSVYNDTNMKGSGEPTDNTIKLQRWNIFEYHIDDNNILDKLVYIDARNQFDTLEHLYCFIQGNDYRKIKDCDHQTFWHECLISGHEYKMKHDPVYRRETERIDSTHEADKAQRRKEMEEAQRKREAWRMDPLEMQKTEEDITHQEQIDLQRRQNLHKDSTYIYIPFSFTPNQNGMHDLFLPTGIRVKKWKMEIYSRWGEQVFATEDLYQGWDGKCKDKYAASDNYIYKISYTDNQGRARQRTGQLLLLR